jgi:trehalose 6-phosphate synthase/phosphatase
VQTFNVHRWVASFLEQLSEVPQAGPRSGATAGAAAAHRTLTERLAETDSLLLLLDYDGTLVPFTPTPELARPDREILTLLRALAVRPDTEVHVVSGRPQDTLHGWLGDLPLWLRRRWVSLAIPRRANGSRRGAGRWRGHAAMLRESQRTPARWSRSRQPPWPAHRMADQETGARRANELRLHLNQVLSNQPVEILAGNRVIEIRPYGVHKGRIVPILTPDRQAATAIVAIGDDRTDEDLFNVLPPEAITIRVGPGTQRS